MKKRLLLILTLATILYAFMSSSNIDAASKNQKAMQAYETILTDENEMERVLNITPVSGLEECQFDIIDLNCDGVNEMIFTSDCGYHIDIIAYVSGEAKRVGSGYAGSETFYPNKKIYHSVVKHGGEYYSSYYKFDGKKMKLVAEKIGNDCTNVVTGKAKKYNPQNPYAPYKYSINGKVVPKNKYKKYIKKLMKGAKKKEIDYKNNTINNRSMYF